jgi:GNAT superfamily N-acetyltransferase
MAPLRSPVAGRAGHPMAGAAASDTDVLSQVIADAFFDLAVSQWLIASPDARKAIFPGYFKLYVEHALADGLVHTSADRTAVALWIPAGQNPADPMDGYDARLAAATGPWIGRFRAFDAALDNNHPRGVSHHHLAILAVRSDRQGHGTGTALLDAHHAALDRDGLPAYLEASGPRTRDLYLRHGYVLRSDAPFYLPDGGPPMWPMWREPQPNPDTS